MSLHLIQLLHDSYTSLILFCDILSYNLFIIFYSMENSFLYGIKKVLLKPYNFCLKIFFLSFILSTIFALKEKYHFFFRRDIS